MRSPLLQQRCNKYLPFSFSPVTPCFPITPFHVLNFLLLKIVFFRKLGLICVVDTFDTKLATASKIYGLVCLFTLENFWVIFSKIVFSDFK